MAMRGEKTKEHEGTRGTMFNDRVVQTFKRLVYLEQITQSVLSKQKDAVAFYRGMVTLDTHFAETILPIKHETSKEEKKPRHILQEISMMEWLMIIEDMMYITFGICGALIAVVLSHKPQFISILWENHTVGFLTFLAGFQFYTIEASCGSIIFCINYAVLYMIAACHWLKTLRRLMMNIGINTGQKLDIFCILGCYKKLQILNASLNTAHASFLCPLNLTMFFTTSILTMFGAIRLKEVATLAEYILFPLACTFLLTLFSALLFGSELIYDYSSKLKCMFFFAGSLSAIYAVYLAFQMVAQLIWNTGESKNFVNIFWTFLWGLYYWWATGNNLNIFVRQDDADTFIGGMVQLDSHFETTITEKSKPVPVADTTSILQRLMRMVNVLELLMLIQDFMVVAYAVCATVMAVSLSNKPQFISFVWNSGTIHSVQFLIIFALFEFYAITSSCSGIIFFTNYFINYMMCTLHWMNSMRKVINESFWTCKEVDVHRFQRSYRKLQILNAYFNHAHMGFVYSMTLTMFFTTSVFTLFGSIRLKAIAPIVEYMLFPLACTFLLVLFTALLFGSASVYESSIKLLETFKKPRDTMSRSGMNVSKRWMQKECVALKPFGVQIGTLQFLKKASMLVIYERLLNYTASLLIAYPDSYFLQQ
ncbi:hypothetical protein Fcan01_06902 [Folsomia candida]|uniref:Uncharacterized protein n=1 Tax=Folsomia candida TaxID=158441 RepID=A0A226EIB0_FOLCA|nr:hypothetical protein Fcan01_06902 [Folsomia candida]